MKIVTRLATSSDGEAIVGLWRRFMAEEDDAVPDAQIEQAQDPWTQRLEQQIREGKAIVADFDGKTVGFLGFIDAADRPWVPDGVAYVVDVYVAPEARNSTAARRLFETLLGQSQRQYSEIWTNTNIRNKRVQMLLTRVGFTPMEGFTIEGLENQQYYRLDTFLGQDFP